MKLETKFEIGDKVWCTKKQEKQERCPGCSKELTITTYTNISGEISNTQITHTIANYFDDYTDDSIFRTSREAQIACFQLNTQPRLD